MTDAIDTLIAELRQNRITFFSQALRCKVDDAVAALLEIQSGLAPAGPEAANTVYAGPASGGAALPNFRLLAEADIEQFNIATANKFFASPSGAGGNPSFRAIVASDLPAGTTPVGANPTATAKDTAVNGVALTFMRSDAAPAIQKATNAQFGLVEGDGTTITIVGGVASTVLTQTSGNFAPADASGAGLVYTAVLGTQVITGSNVFCNGNFTVPANGSGASLACTLPSVANVVTETFMLGSNNTTGVPYLCSIARGTAALRFFSMATGVAITNTSVAGNQIKFSGTYNT